MLLTLSVMSAVLDAAHAHMDATCRLPFFLALKALGQFRTNPEEEAKGAQAYSAAKTVPEVTVVFNASAACAQG